MLVRLTKRSPVPILRPLLQGNRSAFEARPFLIGPEPGAVANGNCIF
jgi:hypothetical protein